MLDQDIILNSGRNTMLYAFELSGEHDSLPYAEALACLRKEGILFEQKYCFDQCLVVDIPDMPELYGKLQKVSGSIALAHHILKVITVCENDENSIIDIAEKADISEHITPGKTYVVRAKRIKHNSNLNCANMERRIGGAIYRKGYSADLQEADVEFRLIFAEKCVFGSIIATVDRSAYEARAPHKKPFFYPGVLRPRIARALVNLAQVGEGDIIFDPFCGTAGILVEAGMLNAYVIGLEVRQKIAIGASMNLRYFNADHDLILGDATSVPLEDECIDAIITDPPYGRSARIEASSIHHLYSESFREMYRVLKRGSIAVIVSEMDIKGHADESGFVIVERYFQRVHKSLTRNITILQKN